MSSQGKVLRCTRRPKEETAIYAHLPCVEGVPENVGIHLSAFFATCEAYCISGCVICGGHGKVYVLNLISR